MIVIHPWNEGTNDKIVSLERLMNRRWHMDASSYRFKVVNIESIRIEKTIPPYHIERVMPKNMRMNESSRFRPYFKLTEIRMCLQRFRQSKISFTKWAVFKQLSMLVPISLWCRNPTVCFNDEEFGIFVPRNNAIDRANRHDDVIPRAIRKGTEHRFHSA